MQVCLACSTTTAENSGRFCPECGAVLTAQMDADKIREGIDTTAATHVPDKPAGNIASTETSRLAADHGSLVGTKVDGFSFEGVIGGGAFGTVYRGRQLGLDRIVAIKVPTYEIASDPIMAKRFAREAKAAARIAHPGVVAIHGVGELPDGRPYIAMQLVEGQPLDTILEGGPIPVVRALEIVRQVASALSDTHAAGVVHRDLKPSNIMWRRDRSGDDRITLVDFGIAASKASAAEATRLTAGNLIGTPHYMSPEQAHGEVVDARADLYALGCLLFELITGDTPYAGSGVEVLLAHLGKPAPRASDRNAAITESVDRLVLALMAKKPDERVESADRLVELIDDTLETLGDAEPAAPRPPTRPKRKTTSTKKDRPPIPIPKSALEPLELSPPTPPLPRARWMAVGAALAFMLSVGAVLVVRMVAGPATAGSGATTEPAGSARAQQPSREIFRDDGETRLRAYVPDPFVAGKARIWIELRNKLGAPIVADSLIVTIEDPQGTATAITARPRGNEPTQFAFTYDYVSPGAYHLRVYPPEDVARSPSTFAIPLEVAAK